MDTSLSSKAKGKQILVDPVDSISKLPDDLLIMILKKMTTHATIKTSVLSTRWNGVWKQIPCLHFDMRRAFFTRLREPICITANNSDRVAKLITKVIENHNGHLMSCIVKHLSHQFQDGTLETWILSLIHEKHTKSLQLSNLLGCLNGAKLLQLPSNTFSDQALESLFLFGYGFKTAHAFSNCHNLKVLKLRKIIAELDVFNTVIASCPSLKVLILDIRCQTRSGHCLKIHNDNLKLLQVKCSYVDSIEVTAAFLDIFSVPNYFSRRCNFVIKAPRLWSSPKLWVADEDAPHNINYNISYNAQEIENIGHNFVVNILDKSFMSVQSLAVIVDLLNPKEVQMLKEVLVAWSRVIRQLEILFKHNNVTKQEDEKNKWEDVQMFPNTNFRVEVVSILNFNGSNKEQFALASYFITQVTKMKKMMIKTSSVPTKKKLKIEAAVAKLMELPKGNEELSIECF